MLLSHLKSLLNKHDNFRSDLIKFILDEFYENASENTIISFQELNTILQENGMAFEQESEVKSMGSDTQDDTSLFYLFITGVTDSVKNLKAIKQNEVKTLNHLPQALKQDKLYPFLDQKDFRRLAVCSYENYKEMEDKWKKEINFIAMNGIKLKEIKVVQNYKRLMKHLSTLSLYYGNAYVSNLPLWSLLCLSGEIPAIKHAISHEDLSEKSEYRDVNALYFTMLSGSVEAVQYILSLGYTPTIVGDYSRQDLTLLHWAALSGSVAAIRYAIHTLQSSPQGCDHFGRNALHYAVVSGSIKAIKYILSLGISANNVDIEYNNIMHFAAEFGNSRVISWLLQNASSLEINLKAINKKGEDFFALFSSKTKSTDDQKIIGLVNKSFSFLENKKSFSQILLNKTTMRKSGLEILLKKHDNFRSTLMKLILDKFYEDAYAGTGISFKEIVDHLQKNGIIFTTLAETIEKNNNISLFYQFIKGEYQVLIKESEEQQEGPKKHKSRGILDSFPNDFKTNAFVPFFTPRMLINMSMCSSNYYEINYEDFWIKKITHLNVVSQNQHLTDEIREMLKEKMIHFKDLSRIYNCMENLVLMYGVSIEKLPIWSLYCMSGKVSVIQYAIAYKGLKQDSCYGWGMDIYPFHFIALSGSVEVMKFAISKGFSPNHKGYYGQNSSHYAAWSGSVEAMHYAIEVLEILPTSTTSKGENISHYAAMSGSIEAVKYALSHSFPIEENKCIYNILHYAILFNRASLVFWLCQNADKLKLDISEKSRHRLSDDVFDIAKRVNALEIEKILERALKNKQSHTDKKPMEEDKFQENTQPIEDKKPVKSGEIVRVPLDNMKKPIGESKFCTIDESFIATSFFKNPETSKMEELSNNEKSSKKDTQDLEKQKNGVSKCLVM